MSDQRGLIECDTPLAWLGRAVDPGDNPAHGAAPQHRTQVSAGSIDRGCGGS